MPIYVCESVPQTAGEQTKYVEFEQRMTDEPLTTHPEADAPLRRIFRGGFSVGRRSQGDAQGCCGSASGVADI